MNTASKIVRDRSQLHPGQTTFWIAILALFSAGFVDVTLVRADTWSMRGLEGKTINALVIDPVDPSSLYAATDEGVFKTTDRGAKWKATEAGQRGEPTRALVIDPMHSSTLYGLGRQTHKLVLYSSRDGGDSWVEVTTDLNPDHFLYYSARPDLAIRSTNPSTLYLINTNIWVSTDRGAHWRTLASWDSAVLVLAIDPRNESTLYLGTDTLDAKKSTDGGATWRNLLVLVHGHVVPILALAIDSTDPVILYAGTGDGIYKSTNSGERWMEISGGIPIGPYNGVGVLAIDPMNPSVVYAGFREYVYKSVNSGESWSDISSGLTAVREIWQLVIDPKQPTRLYAGTSNGVWVIQQ